MELNSEVAFQEKIESLRFQQRFGEAVHLIEEALTKFPGSVGIRVERGWLHFYQHQYDQAIRAFEEVLAIEPSEEGALQGKVASLREKGRYEDAYNMLQQALRYHPTSQGLLSERGWLYLAQNQGHQAAKAFMEAQNEDGTQQAIGKLQSQHRLDEAARAIEDALIQFPTSNRILSEQAWLYFNRRQYDRAREAFDRVLDINPSEEGALQGKIASLRKQRRYKEAELEFEQALPHKPKRLGLLSERGWLYFDQGQLDQAVAYFRDLFEQNPTSAPLGLSVAEVLMWTDRSAEALGILEKLHAQFPDDLEVREKLGLYFLRRNDLVRAETEFQTIHEQDPQNALGINGLGLVYFSQGRYEAAANCFRNVLRTEPKNPVFLTNLARSLVRMEDPEELDRAESIVKRPLTLILEYPFRG